MEERDQQEAWRIVVERTGLPERQVKAVLKLFEDGNTLPFIARYRKEATGGLDEQALRLIEDTYAVVVELLARKQTILKSIEEQGLLTKELRQRIEACDERQSLEDLYLPFRPKRKTRASKARDAGLQPLADFLLSQSPLETTRSETLQAFVSAANGISTKEEALQGAGDIVAEQWAEEACSREWLAQQMRDYGRIASRIKRGKKQEAEKFENYFDFSEPVSRVPSHRLLAMKRGEAEGFLKLEVDLNHDVVIRMFRDRLGIRREGPFRRELEDIAQDCFDRLLKPAVETNMIQQLKDKADEEAVSVFGNNLRDLLLAPPAGPKTTLGVDPGFRTGCKLAVVDPTGKFLESETIYPTPPRNDQQSAKATLDRLMERHSIELIAIGNGTASRETDQFIGNWLSDRKSSDLPCPETVMVSESGASIYSASPLAAEEYPDLDVTVRGAISIAHRLQDPLAELVKIDPKSIGVGQYQHDVNPGLLKRGLDREVESCVNSVGVNLNLASRALLSHVSGIGPKLAERIVEYRDQQGEFKNRKQLLSVPKLGPKAYEQAAGFLRIPGGEQALDNSAVHPEQYGIVRRMANQLGVESQQLVGDDSLVGQLRAADFVDDTVGAVTIEDIIQELAKPGRDPRQKFRVAKFDDSIQEIEDLEAGMILEGVITNVTNFGAFIDLGVHQDGLIHVSELSHKYVQAPADVVSVGDIVKVKVLEVDTSRRRIAVSAKRVSSG